MDTGEYTDSFTVCFNMMKLKYQSYDKDIDDANFLAPGDKVNVFISFETVLKNISQIKDVDRKMILERDFKIIMESATLNLAAHYKRFFAQNGLQTRVFLYYTDLKSDDYDLWSIHEDFRSYYEQKFMSNPKFSYLGDMLTSSIIPDVQTISNFINGVYFISTKDFDSSLVPIIVANMDKSWKNLVITGDCYDTQYQFNPRTFLTHYIKRVSGNTTITYTIQDTIKNVFFDKDDDCKGMISLISSNLTFYNLLLAAKGSKIRSIDTIKGIGYKTIIRYIMKALESGKIEPTTKNLDIILDIFPAEIQDDLRVNFKCTDVVDQYRRLTSEELFSIEKQIVDRSDNNSLAMLNAKKFYHHQLMLQELTL